MEKRTTTKRVVVNEDFRHQVLVNTDKSRFAGTWEGTKGGQNIITYDEITVPHDRLSRVQKFTKEIPSEYGEAIAENGLIKVDLLKRIDSDGKKKFSGIVHYIISKDAEDERVVSVWDSMEEDLVKEIDPEETTFSAEGLKVFLLPLNSGAVVSIVDKLSSIVYLPIVDVANGIIGSCYGSSSAVKMSDLVRKIIPELKITIKISEGKLILSSKVFRGISDKPGYFKVIHKIVGEDRVTKIYQTHLLRR